MVTVVVLPLSPMVVIVVAIVVAIVVLVVVVAVVSPVVVIVVVRRLDVSVETAIFNFQNFPPIVAHLQHVQTFENFSDNHMLLQAG